MPAPLDIGLTCQPRRDGNSLVFNYELRNRSRTAVHVADAFRTVDHETLLASANDQLAIIMARGESEVVVSKLVPPTPPGWIMAVPMNPLAVLLEPGATIARSLTVQLPLIESSPLLGDLPIRQYDMVDLQAVVLAIACWAADTPGLVAKATQYSPQHMQLTAPDLAKAAQVISQRLPTHGLALLKRKDDFPRTM